MSDRSLRAQVLEVLGNKCSRCGWGEVPEGLTIWSKVDPNPKGRRYYEWLARVLVAPDKQPYWLLCPNCHFVGMRAAKAGQDQPGPMARPGLFVWQSRLQLEELRGAKVRWLERKVAEGVRVVVIVVGGKVVEYGKDGVGRVLASSWGEFAQQEGLGAEEPETGEVQCS